MQNKYHIILASNSPRRKQLLAGLDLDFEVRIMPGIEESYPQDLSTDMIPEYLACQKAAAYTIKEGELLITADTIVVLEGSVLGKPANAQDAKHMLQALRGKTHSVITGVALTTTHCQRVFHVVTEVTFGPLSDQAIDYYIATYQPYDKAGAYGIQEWIGYVGVTSLRGSFFNVMGLPVQRIYEEIPKL